jgi:CheY-like chemotaxis protein
LSSKLKKVNYNWKSKTILIVEDEDHNYIYAKEILKRTGVQTLRAVNGREAITMFMENQVDIILMDIKLPEIDGYNATGIIKKKNKDIVIIAVTAYSMSSEKDISKKAGCDDYIAKPYPPFKLLEMINKYF